MEEVLKKYRLNIIKARYPYTVSEISELLGVCNRTVRRWITEGLPAIKKSRPWIVLGHHLKEFLSKKLASYKFSLQDGQFPCLKCRKGVLPTPGTLRERIANKIGKGKRTIVLEATCSICNSQVRRFDAQLELSCIGNPEEFKKKEKGFESLPLFKHRRTG